jgi:putative FmdB family regulatory protein
VLVFGTLIGDPIFATTRFPLPLYDYQCRACRKTVEVRHGFKETYDDACPDCGGEMARVFTPAPILFKGSGFYLTDSRKASDKGSDSAPAAATSAPATPAAPAAPAAPPKSESAA